MTKTNISIRLYVGTYKKYNEGSLFGEWVELTDYSSIEELYQHFAELHSDEDDPEYMFQDWEAPELFKNMIGESYLNENIYEAIEAIQNASYEMEVYEAYAYCFGAGDDIAELIENAEESYQGEFDSDEDFAEEMAERCGMIDKDVKWPYTCIDWEWAARELMYDYSEHKGHYFRCI